MFCSATFFALFSPFHSKSVLSRGPKGFMFEVILTSSLIHLCETLSGEDLAKAQFRPLMDYAIRSSV